MGKALLFSWGGVSLIFHPWGSVQRPSATIIATKLTIGYEPGLTIFNMGKKGNSPLKSVKCCLQICPTLSPSWGGASPIFHPRGPYQSPKVIRGTTKRTFINALARDAKKNFWRHLLSTSKSTAAPLKLFNDRKGSLQPAV